MFEFKVDNAVHWINLYPVDIAQLVSVILICWIVIYPVDSAIQCLSNCVRRSAVASVISILEKNRKNLSSSRICDYQLCLVFFCPGTRSNAEQTDLSEILPEDVEEQVKAAAEISMGTEVTFYFCGNNLVSYPLIEK